MYKNDHIYMYFYIAIQGNMHQNYNDDTALSSVNDIYMYSM